MFGSKFNLGNIYYWARSVGARDARQCSGIKCPSSNHNKKSAFVIRASFNIKTKSLQCMKRRNFIISLREEIHFLLFKSLSRTEHNTELDSKETPWAFPRKSRQSGESPARDLQAVCVFVGSKPVLVRNMIDLHGNFCKSKTHANSSLSNPYGEGGFLSASVAG